MSHTNTSCSFTTIFTPNDTLILISCFDHKKSTFTQIRTHVSHSAIKCHTQIHLVLLPQFLHLMILLNWTNFPRSSFNHIIFTFQIKIYCNQNKSEWYNKIKIKSTFQSYLMEFFLWFGLGIHNMWWYIVKIKDDLLFCKSW